MSRRWAIIVALGFLAAVFDGRTRVMAATWTTGGGTFTRAQINANIADGDDITVNVNTIFNIDDATNTDKIIGITVNNGISLTVNFTSTGNVVLGNTSNATITITGTGTMTATGTSGGCFDFSGETNKVLTIIGAVGGTQTGSKFNVGNNTLKTMTTTGNLNDVSIGGANALLDIDVATTIDTLTIASAGDDLVINIAEGLTLTLDDQFDIPANSIVDLTGTNGGASETLALTGGIRLNGSNAELQITGDTGNITVINGGVTVNADTGIIDVNENASIIGNVIMNAAQGDLTIAVANGKTLTTTVDVNDNTLTLSEAGTVSTVNLDSGNGILDVNEDCTVTTCSLAPTTTIAYLNVANTKTLTCTNGVDTNTAMLVLNDTGTVSRVDIDGAGGSVKLQATSGTISTLNHDAAGTINLGTNGCNLTVANLINVGARKLILFGSGGGVAEILTAAVNLNNAASELEVIGVAADNITVSSLRFGAAGATLDVDASCQLTSTTFLANGTVDVADAQTLTADLNIGNHTLTLTGAGTVTQVTGTAGQINADGATTITTLTANAGASGMFTYSGTGSSTVTTITPFDIAGEILAKTGTGTLTATNGFSFAGTTGIKLQVNAGTFVDAGGNAVTFGDNDEEITVANGATYTTSSDITGQSGTNTNLDAVAGSTINFAKAGTLILTAIADDDFKMLGTVNVLDGCTVQMAGALQSQFGSVNVKNTGALVNAVPSSTMLFAQGSTLTLEGTGSGMLNVDGQATTTRITVDTTTGSGTFTINRGSSSSMTFKNVDLSNCTYASTAGGAADTELTLTGVLDTANNTNWFSSLAANAGADKTIVSGNSTTLDGSASGGTGTYTYSWTPTTGLSDATIAAPTASPMETTTYTLTVSDGVNTATDTVIVTVTTAPTPTPGPTTSGIPLCGPGAAPLMPLALLGLVGCKWSLRRRKSLN